MQIHVLYETVQMLNTQYEALKVPLCVSRYQHDYRPSTGTNFICQVRTSIKPRERQHGSGCVQCHEENKQERDKYIIFFIYKNKGPKCGLLKQPSTGCQLTSRLLWSARPGNSSRSPPYQHRSTLTGLPSIQNKELSGKIKLIVNQNILPINKKF